VVVVKKLLHVQRLAADVILRRITAVLVASVLMPTPPYAGGIMDWWPSSVCLPVPFMTLSQERKGLWRWKLAGRKAMTRVTHDPI